MKGILEFDLDDHFEKNTFQRAVNADRTIAFIDDFANLLRQYRKYGIPQEIKSVEDLIELLESQFYDKLREYNVNREE